MYTRYPDILPDPKLQHPLALNLQTHIQKEIYLDAWQELESQNVQRWYDRIRIFL